MFAILGQLAIDGLEPQRILPGGVEIADLEVCGGLGPQVLLIGFQLADLAHQPFAKSGMGSQSLVVLRNLLAQVFGLHLKQSFRILHLHTRHG